MDSSYHIQRELRYGAPPCDEILIGRYFTIGYSYFFKQAKWTLEIINRDDTLIYNHDYDGNRLDNFRPDLRISSRFGASKETYVGSGYDRGHLVASANSNNTEIYNSETFLLSNVSPQLDSFNRGMWKDLEIAIRELNDKKDVLETYVLTCPLFYFRKKIETIQADEPKATEIPVPHGFIKSVLAEKSNGKIHIWTFRMDNKKLKGKLKDYLITTYKAERLIGGRFWGRLSGSALHQSKSVKPKMWQI